ncbi:MAG TPA: stage II sporulation protein M, partial [Caldimonas sp.]|nr:stage II sporulation protein M [Caldimonas sp.]
FEKGRSSRLSDDDIIALPVLYRAALSSLSVARAISLDQNLIAYLESLSTRAYFCVYGTRARLGERVAGFFAYGWREAVRSLWIETLFSAGLTILGIVVAFVMTRSGSDWFYAFIPADLAQGRDPTASTADLKNAIFSSHHDGLAVFATFLFNHNTEVAFLAFALGFACCLPTAFLMIVNGATLGALLALYVEHGLGVEFGGWVMIHGVTELFAVTLAGAAGFKLGWALAFPGNRSRADALAAAGRTAALVMAGVVIMLAVAGLLEGFARQLITSTPIRYTIAIATGAFWLSYYYLGRSPARGDG